MIKFKNLQHCGISGSLVVDSENHRYNWLKPTYTQIV